MEIHNKADSVVDFDGVPAAMRFWTRFNGRVGEPETTKISDILAQVQYCEGPAEVVGLYVDDDSDDFGRRWPRTKVYGFEATQPIWESFSRH
jgi:hypothetical protein